MEECILYIPISKYEPGKGRFRSECMENSSDDSGLSVVSLPCVSNKASNPCDHGRAYYPNIAGDAPIFFVFVPSEIFGECSLEEVPSDSGDDCHRNLKGVSDKQAKKLMQNKLPVGNVNFSQFKICAQDGIRAITQADIDILYQKYLDYLATLNASGAA